VAVIFFLFNFILHDERVSVEGPHGLHSFFQMHCFFFSKYFKMLKAKVPPSWVKRVLEVDGKDARVLDLDPDQTLADQLPFGAVDEFGTVDWAKVNPPEHGYQRNSHRGQ
jgi:hypothetical protein